MHNKRICLTECRARVEALIIAGHREEARHFIRSQLESQQLKDLRDRAALLDLLILVEVNAGRIVEGLGLAKQSKDMPVRSRTARLDSYLSLCNGLIRRGRIADARNVSKWMLEIGIPNGYSGVFEVISTYVATRRKIPQSIEPVLVELANAAEKRFGIPIGQSSRRDAKIKDRILRMAASFQDAAERFQNLVLAVGSGEKPREELVNEYLDGEDVTYFRKAAKML